MSAVQGTGVDNTSTSSSGLALGGASDLPFQIRGSLQTVLCLRVLRPNDPAFFENLTAKIAHNPEFFRNAPLVIDVGTALGMDPSDLKLLVERLRSQHLAPVGLQNGSDEWNEEAGRLGLGVFAAGAEPKQAPPRRPNSPARGEQVRIERVASVVARQPVRGGQQVMSEGDLVVMAAVSSGAEIAAVGNVHVYGSLRGRVFAGIDGDETTMIFCDQMNAELVSIAGIHAVNEDIDERLLGKRVRVSCEGQRLHFQPLP
ncbi:MAG: septum site-determining protein MinC [Geminicoccaceae bacterium]|nr:septum site-determining protein MinC [Geminicoccaceae bacterium]